MILADKLYVAKNYDFGR